MLRPLNSEIHQIPVIATHTGTNPDTPLAVYAVALRLLKPGGEIEKWESLLEYHSFNGKDRRRSGLTREEVQGGTNRVKAAKEIRSRIGNAPFVVALCHPDYISEVKSICGDARIVDLMFAVQYFLPWLPSSTPKAMWELVNPTRKWPKVSMTVEELADLGVSLIRYLSEEYLNDSVNVKAPAIRFQLAESKTLFGDLFKHVTENFTSYFGGLIKPRSQTDTGDWMQHLDRVPKDRSSKATEDNSFQPVPIEALMERFSTLVDRVDEFNLREQQTNYARAVAEVFNDKEKQILAVEAGTGTGKTFGYLLPAMEFLYRNKSERVAISTYTKNLQSQVFENELEQLVDLFPIYKDIPKAILKGRSSYVCTEKLENVLDAEGLQGIEKLMWTYYLNILFNSYKVDIGVMGDRVRKHLDSNGSLTSLCNEVSAKTGCTPYHARCPAQLVNKQAKSARLIVTNHHKLARLDADPILAGLFDRCVIDEANHFEQAVRESLKIEINSRDILMPLEYIATKTDVIKKIVSERARENIENVEESIQSVREEIKELSSAFRAMVQGQKLFGEEWLEPSNAVFREGNLFNNLRDLAVPIQTLSAELRLVMIEQRRPKSLHARTRKRLYSILDGLEATAENILSYTRPRLTNENFFTLRSWIRHWCLSSQPVDVGNYLKREFYPEKHSILFTSATLTYRDSLRMFLDTLGLAEVGEGDEGNYPCHALVSPSPFDPAQREIILPALSQSGKYDEKEVWLDSICRTIPSLVRKNKGRSLVLFVSYTDMERVIEVIGDELEEAGFPVLVQRRNRPTVHLSEEFRAVKESVLFGTETFWYGVDFKGDTLTQVIITRIPFANPYMPLYKGRQRHYSGYEMRDRTNFDAAIKLKQGIGRLIRGENDRGKVYILDSRYSRFERTAKFGLPAKVRELIPDASVSSIGDKRKDSATQLNIPNKSIKKKELERKESKDVLPALLFRKSSKNPFLRKKVLEAAQGKCSSCGKELSQGEVWGAKRSILDNDCAHKELKVIVKEAKRRGKKTLINIKVPVCERCFIESHQAFKTCVSLTTPVCQRCLIIESRRERSKSRQSRKSDFVDLQKKRMIENYDVKELRQLALDIGNGNGDRAMLPSLFSHDDYETRRRACSAAAKLKDCQVVKHIAPCLYATEPQVRQYALRAVLQSRCADLLEDVKVIREKEEKDYNLRLCKEILEQSSSWLDQCGPNHDVKKSLEDILMTDTRTTRFQAEVKECDADMAGSLAKISKEVLKIPLRINTHSAPENIDEIREKYPRAYEVWSEEENELLRAAAHVCREPETLCKVFQRQPSSMVTRLSKMGLTKKKEPSIKGIDRTSILNKMRKIIKDEQGPLSDYQLKYRLHQYGIDIARRTVNKYRKMLDDS